MLEGRIWSPRHGKIGHHDPLNRGVLAPSSFSAMPEACKHILICSLDYSEPCCAKRVLSAFPNIYLGHVFRSLIGANI